MTKTKGKILVVDDNAGIRQALKILLPRHFDEVELLPSPKLLLRRMEEFRPDAVLLDMNFDAEYNSGNEGLWWLGELKSRWPDTPVVLFTAYADISLAVEGMKRGAFDFIVKPWDNEKLLEVLEKAVGSRSGTERKVSGTPAMRWGEGPEMLAVKKLAERIAPTDATVLISGENGTGKDLLAAEIHRMSARSGKPMVCVDLGAVTETLFESELFGHVKGAFTDARSDHTGKFEQADGGTLFLDEIGNIPLHLQAKLLRALQNRCITRVGGSRSIPVDIRLICATNMDLPRMVAEGRFREDLWYRINTTEIQLPPLRERRDEILPLAEMFLKEFSVKYGRAARSFSKEAADALLKARWSGNIRELRNAVEKAAIVSESGTITAADLSLRENACAEAESTGEETLEQMEERMIRAAIRKFNGNLSLVARSLDISRPTLYSKLKKYNI